MPETQAERDAILMEIEISAPPGRVFEALTRPEELTAWWGEEACPCTAWVSDLRVGGRWRGEWLEANGRSLVIAGTFLEVDPPRRLAYTWECSGREEWRNLPATTVTLTLEPRGDAATHLRLEHTGFAGFATAGDEFRQGWPGVLAKLKSHVERA